MVVRLQRGEKGDDQGNAKRKWFEEKQKRREEELQRLGLPAAEIHRIQTAEHAEQMYKKQDKKVAPTGWEAFNQKALYEAYERRAGNIPYSQEVRDAMKDSRNGCLVQWVGSALFPEDMPQRAWVSTAALCRPQMLWCPVCSV